MPRRAGRLVSPDAERPPLWDLSADSIAALAAVVAALIALWVGVWENVQVRRHNRLSVTPFVNFAVEIRTPRDSTPVVAVWLANQGVGPVVIDSMAIVLRVPSGEERRYPTWSEAAPELTSWGLEIRRRADMSAGAMLSDGERLPLLEFSAGDSAGLPGLVDLVGRIGVVLDYSSIYGDRFRRELDTTASP